MAPTRVKAGSLPSIALAAVLAASLSACSLFSSSGEGASDEELAELDDNLSTGADPEVRGALEDRILVDPSLTDSANRNAVRSGGGLGTGAIPPDGGPGGKAAANAEFEGRGMLSAPEPTVVSAEDCTSCSANSSMTLGAMAEAQTSGRGKGTCDAKISYDMDWANRMPPEFRVYPQGRVKEAAGVDGGKCDIRVVSFTTDARMKDVVDYYYTKARRSGYSAEYQIRGGDHVLGGTRDVDDGAYVIFLEPTGSGTAVDIVANNGR